MRAADVPHATRPLSAAAGRVPCLYPQDNPGGFRSIAARHREPPPDRCPPRPAACASASHSSTGALRTANRVFNSFPVWFSSLASGGRPPDTCGFRMQTCCYSARKTDPLELRDINALPRRSASNLRAEQHSRQKKQPVPGQRAPEGSREAKRGRGILEKRPRLFFGDDRKEEIT